MRKLRFNVRLHWHLLTPEMAFLLTITYSSSPFTSPLLSCPPFWQWEEERRGWNLPPFALTHKLNVGEHMLTSFRINLNLRAYIANICSKNYHLWKETMLTDNINKGLTFWSENVTLGTIQSECSWNRSLSWKRRPGTNVDTKNIHTDMRGHKLLTLF